MPVSINNTQIVFNDSTTQSTAAVSWPGVFTGTTATNLSFPIGTDLISAGYGAVNCSAQNVWVGSTGSPNSYALAFPGPGNVQLAGSWRARGSFFNGAYIAGVIVQRVS